MFFSCQPAEPLTVLRAWCKQCLPGRWKPHVLRPGVVGKRGTTVTRLRPCMMSSTPHPLPNPPTPPLYPTTPPLLFPGGDDRCLCFRLKVEIALAQGKNVRDKREDIKDRDAKRDMQRITKNAYD